MVTVTATPAESLVSFVSLTLTRKLSVVVPATAGAMKLGVALVRLPRLSVQPVTEAEWRIVCQMGGLG